jgi:hypothetical protein
MQTARCASADTRFLSVGGLEDGLALGDATASLLRVELADNTVTVAKKSLITLFDAAKLRLQALSLADSNSAAEYLVSTAGEVASSVWADPRTASTVPVFNRATGKQGSPSGLSTVPDSVTFLDDTYLSEVASVRA